MGVGGSPSARQDRLRTRCAPSRDRRSSGELTRPNASRISVVTGLTRAEVANILAAADR